MSKEQENPVLQQEVGPDSELKEWFINYVGQKTEPEEGRVTVHEIITVMSEEFPEFILAMAEENFVRGYQQALTDVEEGEDLLDKKQKKNKEG
tara:strand:- start:196 stop:474 length:279 start_codon:yes stop_codon:yes gene_type:complete